MSAQSDSSTTMPKTAEDTGMRSALWSVALCGAALTLGSPFWFDGSGAFGVALGSALAVANLWALARIVRAFIQGAGLPWVLLAAFKLMAVLALGALVLHLGLTTVIPLAVGYGAMPLGIVFAQLAPQPGTEPAGALPLRTREVASADYSGEIDGDSPGKG